MNRKMKTLFLLAAWGLLPVTALAATGTEPTWVYKNLLDLSRGKMISLPPGVTSNNITSLSKEEIVKLTAEATQKQKKLGIGLTENNRSFTGRKSTEYEIRQLTKQYNDELINIGMESEKTAQGTAATADADSDRRAEDAKWYFLDEVRYNYLKNFGDERFRSKSSRLRNRLYVQRKLNKDWSVLGMWEASKYLFGERDDDFSSGNRLYVQGNTGITKVLAGIFGVKMAEGNIYDTYFRGVQTIVDKDPWRYSFMAGRTNGSGDSAAGVAQYDGNDYGLEAGIYYFGTDKWDNRKTTIYELGGNYYLGRFTLGAMYLRSNDSEDSGGQNGVVFTLQHDKVRDWVPGSFTTYAHYYIQPYSTYRSHTMNGLAGYMNGFTGWSIGCAYTIRPLVVWDLEYYSLQDKVTHERGNTIWTSITFGFEGIR